MDHWPRFTPDLWLDAQTLGFTCDDFLVSHGTRRGGRPDTDERLHAACIAAAEFLAPRTTELVDDLLELLRGQLPPCGEETMEELRERIRVVLELAQRRLRQGEVPDIRDAEEIATLARDWAAKGLPLDQRSFQLGARRVVAVVAAHAVEVNLHPGTMFEIQDQIWEWATIWRVDPGGRAPRPRRCACTTRRRRPRRAPPRSGRRPRHR